MGKLKISRTSRRIALVSRMTLVLSLISPSASAQVAPRVGAGGHVGLTFGILDSTRGRIDARGFLDLSSGTIRQRDRLVLSQGAARIVATRVASDGDAILALGAGGFAVDVNGSIDRNRTQIGSNGTLGLSTGSLPLSASGGQLVAEGIPVACAADAMSVRYDAGIAGRGDLALQAGQLEATEGALEAAGSPLLRADKLVLAPRLHVAHVDVGGPGPNGAVLAGENVVLCAADGLVSQDAIRASNITPGDLVNISRLAPDSMGSMRVGRDLINRGASISGGDINGAAGRGLDLRVGGEKVRTAPILTHDAGG